ATQGDQLANADAPKKKAEVSAEDIAPMKQEMVALERDLKDVEESCGDNACFGLRFRPCSGVPRPVGKSKSAHPSPSMSPLAELCAYRTSSSTKFRIHSSRP